ncbi:hypothetical protein HpBT283_12710 [Helicobacter pylori]
MGIDNKIELTQASDNFKKRYQEIRGGAMVSKPPPSLLNFTIKQSFKKQYQSQTMFCLMPFIG